MEDCVLDSTDKMEDIDLEEGKIRINGKWFTEDEIRYAIKMKVSSDDYNVADLAVALRTLIDEMNKSQVLRVRVPKELVEELETLSSEKDETMEALLRRIIMDHVRSITEITDEPENDTELEVEEEDPEEDDFNDIEIGVRSRAAEEIEPEITVEAEPIEEIVDAEEISVEETVEEIPEEELEEELGEVPDAVEGEAAVPEDEEKKEIEVSEDEDILGLDEELESHEEDRASEEPEEIEEEIRLGEQKKEENDPATEEKDEATSEEPVKDEDNKGKKKMILRRKKLLRRRP